MNTVQQTPDLDTAFADLCRVATRLAHGGRPPRSAAVKAALLLHTDPPFDETRLGFDKFRAFLKAAEAAGHVEIRAAAVGPDVDVVPPGVEIPEVDAADARMRSDVWDAFTRWDKGFVRFWDRERGRAHRIEEPPRSSEVPALAQLRHALAEDPDRFVPIENVPVQAVVEWATEFASNQESTASKELLTALGSKLPIRDFTDGVRRLGLVRAWHRAHLAHVTQVVTEWASTYEIDLDLSVQPPTAVKVNTAGREASASEPTTPENLLRKRLHGWIDGMTLPEMLSIPVPVRLLDFPK